MKTDSKTKTTSYSEVIIQDESGMDFVKVKKQKLLSLFAAHLRQISAVIVPVKALAA